MSSKLTQEFAAKKREGRKLLVPYLMAGSTPEWISLAELAISAGADAVEVGIPFSDPSIDGPVIQRAGEMALDAGTTPLSVLRELQSHKFGVPIVVMTYYNIFFRMGLLRSASELQVAGASGVIVPDLPIEEAAGWLKAASKAGVDVIQLVSPVTPTERATQILEHARGFVYGVGLMGITGERQDLAQTATTMAAKITALSELPVLIGIGISSPQHAAAVVQAGADGVVVGSALVRRVIEGQSQQEIYAFLKSIRSALDAR